MHAHLFVHATDSRLIASKNRSQRHPSRLRQECKLTSFLPFQFLDHTGIRGSNGSALASIWVIERVDHQRSAGRVQLISDSALDGGRIAVGVLPNVFATPLARLEPYGMLILIGLLFILPMLGAQLGVDLSIVSRVIASSTDAIIGAILRLTGNA